MNVHMVSLGCARNLVDSEGMLGRLGREGWHIVDDPSEAEVIVVNTCSFIESAAEESIDTILEMAEYKTHGRCQRLVVAGCLPERYREEIVPTLPEVDIFLGTGAYDRILDAVSESLGSGTSCLLPDPDRIQKQGPGARLNSSSHLAYLKVAEGCDKHCTYCIIPKLRGTLKSRSPEDILAEAETLGQDPKIKEIVLIAQDTTNYGQDLAPAVGFDKLLGALAERGVATQSAPRWIRFLYGHPQSLSQSMIETIARFDNLCNYFDIPIQHAGDAVLRKMGRDYSHRDLRELFARIRSMIPTATLRTTVIVGFPGESEADFEALLAFIQEVQFHHLGAFMYSDAEDLPSHGLPDHVEEAVVQQRFERLMACQAEISLKLNQAYIGQTVTVLVEEHPEKNLYVGRTMFQAPEVDGITYIKSNNRLTLGSFVKVHVIDAYEYDLIGEIK